MGIVRERISASVAVSTSVMLKGLCVCAYRVVAMISMSVKSVISVLSISFITVGSSLSMSFSYNMFTMMMRFVR